MFVRNAGYVARRCINSAAHKKSLGLFQEQRASGVFQPHAMIFSVLWLTFHDSRVIGRLTGRLTGGGWGGVEGAKVGHGC